MRTRSSKSCDRPRRRSTSRRVADVSPASRGRSSTSSTDTAGPIYFSRCRRCTTVRFRRPRMSTRPSVLRDVCPGDRGFDGATGVAATGWPQWTGGWALATPAVGDLTGNGTIDVAVTTREGYLHIYSTPGLASANHECWHWHQNDRNTGNVSDPCCVEPSLLRATRTAAVSRRLRSHLPTCYSTE